METKKVKKNLAREWKDVNNILYHFSLIYIPEILYYQNNQLQLQRFVCWSLKN